MKHEAISGKYRREAGSALFFILIGVALFAALSYTVAQMLRGGNPETISEQKSQLFADEILGYGRSLRQATQAVRINGCADMDLSFDNGTVGGYAHMPDVADTCKIFNEGGGGMIYALPSESWLDAAQSAKTLYGEWYFPANVCVRGIGNGTAGCESDSTDNEDILVILPYIKEQVCAAINNSLGLGTTIPVETADGWTTANTKFTGTMADNTALDQTGVMAGCFAGSGANTPDANTYHFFQVLVTR
jgi:hypothetical protein